MTYYSFLFLGSLLVFNFTRSSRSEDDLDSLLGEVEAEVRQHPPATAIDSSEGGVSAEGKTKEKNEDVPADLPEGPSNDPPAPTSMSESAAPPPASLGPQEPEGPTCGKKFRKNVAITFPPSWMEMKQFNSSLFFLNAHSG
ncbi:UNVERIFIED_CONTAM: hypothetical protein Sradi_6948000 [Sesamum radiatum]|uniref:Uncharacterized protein n=1 Tax=Sesamum radiatum TaxID=300843 RepID=A0AAW2JF08_SESRA